VLTVNGADHYNGYMSISGGEGCIQSAAASAIGIGSDVGGSIRMPAFFNGVFGHKATTGLSLYMYLSDFLYMSVSPSAPHNNIV